MKSQVRRSHQTRHPLPGGGFSVCIARPLNRSISIIGAPTDVGAGRRGSDMGPQALRAAGLLAALQALGLDVLDRGDLSGPPNPGRLPVDGYRHLHEVTAWSAAAHDAVHAELALGRLPILLGGDHSLAVGSISAVARHCRSTGKPLRVLWLDAHADCNSRLTTPSGNLHGMPVACLCGQGPEALTRMSGAAPAIRANSIREIGIRSVDAGEQQLVHDLGFAVFNMRTLQTLGMRRVMERALVDMADNTHLHVSFDVDFLDPGIAPGVGTSVRGGAALAEAQLCMAMMAETHRLASLDVVELNPALDVHHATADLVRQLMETLLAPRAPKQACD